jgi:hypothetical protein
MPALFSLFSHVMPSVQPLPAPVVPEARQKMPEPQTASAAAGSDARAPSHATSCAVQALPKASDADLAGMWLWAQPLDL